MNTSNTNTAVAAAHNLAVWTKRMGVELDITKALEDTQRVFPGSDYLGPLAVVVSKMLRDECPDMAQAARRSIAIWAAAGVEAVAKGKFESGTHMATIANRALAAAVGAASTAAYMSHVAGNYAVAEKLLMRLHAARNASHVRHARKHKDGAGMANAILASLRK